ncbi:MAG: glycosyltransferase, partial [Verrucomicrobiae bacterium]|nr:glycosyltransferase [Verrucomicrobiae bacterium]
MERENLVIVPTYNEAGNLAELMAELDPISGQFDCLMVDDSSPDGTGKKIQELQATRPWLHLLERPAKKGLGKAYLAGFRWALERPYRCIAEMDADLSHNPRDLPSLAARCREGYDLVIG